MTRLGAIGQIAGSAATTLILALAPESRIRLKGGEYDLRRYDAVLIEGGAGAAIALASDPSEGFLLIEIGEG